ncbi:potassium channel protein [Candidatus Aerophobetes bacterium]|nr:potassium channel protein [Candidatus Aerophobetes bacterium]
MKLLIAIALIAGMFFVGMVGYVVIEEWSLFDSLYMTAITLTSVGYQEVHPLSHQGRVFTVFLVIGGYGTLAVMIGLVSSFLVELKFKEMRRLRKMEKKLNRTINHYIICGAGEIAEKIMEEFNKKGVSFVLIEKEQEQMKKILEKYPGTIYVEGDATNEDILKKAKIDRAEGLIITFSSDADNLFLVTSAKAINPNLRIISRATREQTQRKLTVAGADAVILPDVVAALRMASLAIRPHVVSFLDVLTGAGELTLNLEEVEIPQGSKLTGKTLGEANIPRETGLIVIAIKRKQMERFQFNPSFTEKINPEDILIVLGNEQQIAKLKRYVK